MARSNRLMELIQILRDGRFHRAEDLAERMSVSLRTIYRDMDTLSASGVPVEGLRGLGFQITAPVTLPPLNLSMVELEALRLGLSLVARSEDPERQQAALGLSARIDAVLPEDQTSAPKEFMFATYPFADAAAGFEHMPAIRAAIRARQKLQITYSRLDEPIEIRHVRPLALDYWGRVWTATTWCETTRDFAEFRVDRIDTLQILPALFVDEDDKSLANYRARRAAG